MKKKLILLGVCTLLLLSAFALAAEGLEIDKWVIAGGGSTLEAGDLVLSGTIGQPVVGRAAAGSLTLSHGFWGMAAVQWLRELFLPLVVR